MSNVRVGLLLLLALPGALPAQRAAAWRDSVLRLGREVRSLQDSLIRGDSTVHEVAHRGDLVLGATLDQQGRAMAAFEYFAAARTRWFGTASPSPDGFRIALRVTWRRGFSGRWWDAQPGLLILSGRPDSGSSERAVRTAGRDDPGRSLVDAFGEMMHSHAEPSIQKWLRRPPPLYLPDAERRELAMYAVVTGTGSAQRGCVTGSIADCAYALGLRDPVGAEPGSPYDPVVRADLLLIALEAGGADAWLRLNQPTGGNIEAALASASGLGIDSLIVRWRQGVLALQPKTAPLDSRQVLVLLGWSVMLLLATLGVSRWA